VFPKETHRRVGKDSGQTHHAERWNNTLRQWLACYTRKTLSFSKSDEYHAWITHLLSENSVEPITLIFTITPNFGGMV
jgi:IS1 family transposase